MKSAFWLIMIFLVMVSMMLAACSVGNGGLVKETEGGPGIYPSNSDTQTEPDGPVDGGVIDNSDPNAKKTIESTQIVSFDCRFSTMDMDEPGALGNHIYVFKAKLESGAVKGTYQVTDTGEERSFRASHDFLNEIQGLVEMYDFAQYNGHSITVSGLPDEYGAKLEVRYASGESIYAGDNQDNYLSPGAMGELIRLFERGAAVTPMLLPFSVEMQYESEASAGGYGEMCYPVYHLDASGYDRLSAALAALNEAKRDGSWTDAFVTRADGEVVSFYERTEYYENADRENSLTEVTVHNLDARTGKELNFSDVFRDMEYLPSLLLAEFERTYPQQTFCDEALDLIRQSVESDDGNISFALGYGCVHIFAGESVLNDVQGGQHITLSYVLNPDQVRAFYTAAPHSWMIPVDNGTVYWRSDTSDCFRIQGSGGMDTEDVIWEVILNENTEGGAYVEPFHGYTPDCWLVCRGDNYYIYLRVPTGDVSMLTKVYRVTPEKVTEIKGSADPFNMALRPDTPLNPDRMLMNINAPIFSPAVSILPYAVFRVDPASGLPQRVEDVYDLDGTWVRLRQRGRYNPARREDAAASGGMWNMAAGERLRPYQTDMESWLDFITEDGRVVRFTIDRFADDMHLDNFGTLDDVFLPDSP